jgi:hypothetical protein
MPLPILGSVAAGHRTIWFLYLMQSSQEMKFFVKTPFTI